MNNIIKNLTRFLFGTLIIGVVYSFAFCFVIFLLNLVCKDCSEDIHDYYSGVAIAFIASFALNVFVLYEHKYKGKTNEI